jgi:sortase (surface protein transpeptidase)
MLCGGSIPTTVHEGESKLMWGSFSRRPSRLVRALIGVGLAIIGVVLVWAALATPSTPESVLTGEPNGPSTPSMSPSAPKPTSKRAKAPEDQDVRDQITGLVLPESEPVAVSIPRIGVRSKLVELRLKKNGEMEVPAPADVGWYSRGPSPGALGPAVIAGHVTWNGAPEVFYHLRAMRDGDHVSVTRKDGRTAVFTVTRVAQFSKSRFPTGEVYGAIDHAGLRLITCGGTYDAARSKYLDNVIVFARLEAVHGPGS